MRTSTERNDRVVVTFDLDEEARANPNYKGKSNVQKKTTLSLDFNQPDLALDLIGGDQIAPQPPKLVGPISIASGYQKAPALQATIRYSKYSLNHSLELNSPCNVTGDALELLGATLTVQIHDPHI